MTLLSPAERERRIREAQSAHLPGETNLSHDFASIPTPVGHANGIRISTNISTQFRYTYRPRSMNVTPSDVVNALHQGGVKRWVLMGLHGYVGYLAQPRATQDVDVLVALDERETAVNAILERWPTLQVKSFPAVIRFIDVGEHVSTNAEGHVIDLMLPNNDCQFAILAEYSVIDEATGHRIPTLEAALAAKYSAFVSPYRDHAKRS